MEKKTPTISGSIEDVERIATGADLEKAAETGPEVKSESKLAEPTVADLSGEGQWVRLRDGKEYLVLPLLIDEMPKFVEMAKKVASIKGIPDMVEKKGEMIDIAHFILKQAYPNLPKEEVLKLISMKNIFQLVEIAMNVSAIDLMLGNRQRPSLETLGLDLEPSKDETSL